MSEERDRIMRACTRFFGHKPLPVRERLRQIAESAPADEYADRYGAGEMLTSFEREIAALLGKEAAVFMPSGTMAQQIALRIHCERHGSRNVALHPQSHLLVSENGAMHFVHGLQPVPVGDRNVLYTVTDLEKIADPLGALLLELPERNIGGVLRQWSSVEAICEWARSRNIALHLDGARLWECQPFYAKSPAELAAPFDTVYVSFYKILNAVAGAALAGPADLIEEARAWQWRHGGRLVQQYPMIVSAREGLAKYLPRIPLYRERARAFAPVLAEFPDVIVTPDPPHTNMMHVFVKGDGQALQAAALGVSERSGIWMPAAWNTTQIPGWHMFELTCGEGSLEISPDDVRDAFGEVFASRGR
jgi:threonine aldolase